jgi:hypothetical protein
MYDFNSKAVVAGPVTYATRTLFFFSSLVLLHSFRSQFPSFKYFENTMSVMISFSIDNCSPLQGMYRFQPIVPSVRLNANGMV